MSDPDQHSLQDFSAEMTTKSVTRTVKFPLETSERKNERVREKIDEWQEIAGYFADVLPSYPEYRWSPQDTHLYRHLTREFPDHELMASTAQQAMTKVVEAYSSWAGNGRVADAPSFGEGDYLRLRNDDLEVHENERGYGLKAKLEPYNPEWFHIGGGDRQRDYLERLTEDELQGGSGELHLHDDGTLMLHLAVSHDVEVYEVGDVSRFVGVDLGENVIYALGIVDSDGVVTAEMESGQEYRHHREQLKRRKQQLQEDGKLREAASARVEYQKYTDYITHAASREIVNTAREYTPCAIKLEDLTGYRESASDPIHDWPYAEIQEKISYKATEEGIPITFVDPRNTSITCRKCGQAAPEYRDGVDFHCTRCDYEIHADVNAAFNIAMAD